ncbi:hypothetical protein DICPUDRAFT_80451 [Dictyostelium purpureum]|uniref:Uncharacterized protein n=1 Tax=Dictyostelium purpureum TaxID=5786 RepID=F0ZQI6_DICPU|nr:uncharacterized protein DICPUDRAFT_80451 [Dictyostelium purpureum]EGC33810.1 hypothetical protein DICPUDRAFT_80451 [Dictyostelium purpureum]|eukprot:XP_003289681.1 hypothetical protein DICPUDRAFT_80451 [Dictyostelium purpureum]
MSDVNWFNSQFSKDGRSLFNDGFDTSQQQNHSLINTSLPQSPLSFNKNNSTTTTTTITTTTTTSSNNFTNFQSPSSDDGLITNLPQTPSLIDKKTDENISVFSDIIIVDNLVDIISKNNQVDPVIRTEKKILQKNDPSQGANIHQNMTYRVQPNNKKLETSTNSRNYTYDLVTQVTRYEEKEIISVVKELEKYNIKVFEHFNLPKESWHGKEVCFSIEIPNTVKIIQASLKNVKNPIIKAGILLKLKYSGIDDWFIGCLTAKATSGSYYLEIQHSGQTFTYPNIQFITNPTKCEPPSFYKLTYLNNRFYAFSYLLKAKPRLKSNSTPKPLVVNYNGREIPYEYSNINFGQTPLYISFEIPDDFYDPNNTQNTFECYYKVLK